MAPFCGAFAGGVVYDILISDTGSSIYDLWARILCIRGN